MSSFTFNILAALAGWLAWNVILLSIYKDENESTFNLKAYTGEHWDNWVASLVMIPILLYWGYKGLNLGIVNMEELHWSDAYYVGSGFATELVKEAWKKYRAGRK